MKAAVCRYRGPQRVWRDHEAHTSCSRGAQSWCRLGLCRRWRRPLPNTQFTELPRVIAQAPVQNALAVATARNGQAIGTYVTNSGHGTLLSPPNQNQGNGN
jgi:hypothetical protein